MYPKAEQNLCHCKGVCSFLEADMQPSGNVTSRAFVKTTHVNLSVWEVCNVVISPSGYFISVKALFLLSLSINNNYKIFNS